MSNLPSITVNPETSPVRGIVSDKQERIKKYRAEASRLASIANKRIQRLEANGMENSPAYQGYLASGGGKFSVTGKSFQEVQAEVGRINRLIKANTSTVRGFNKYTKDLAAETGIKYKTLQDAREQLAVLFEMQNKLAQYLPSLSDLAAALDYQKIWEAINTYRDQSNQTLQEIGTDLDRAIANIGNAILAYETPQLETVNGGSRSDPEESAWVWLSRD